MFCLSGTQLFLIVGIFASFRWLILPSMSTSTCINWSKSDRMEERLLFRLSWNRAFAIVIGKFVSVESPMTSFSCQLNSPPRAHHCPVCDICVFRRDHHCSFASKLFELTCKHLWILATCVGHFNQRYFVAAVVNLWVVMLVCVYWNWGMIFLSLPTFNAAEAWKLMMPVILQPRVHLDFWLF